MSPDTRYEIHLWWSQDDEAWLAGVPDLPGCVADGESRHEALADVLGAIEAWIDAARAFGRPIPAPSERPHAV